MNDEDKKALTAITGLCNMGMIYLFFSLIDLLTNLILGLARM